MPSAYKLLQFALAVFGAAFLFLYPLAVVWPSGWAWHSGAPYQSLYFMMIVGLYATLGVFVLNAARNPQANLSLIWFTVWSSVVHAAIMTVQSFGGGHHMGHMAGDVPVLLVVAVVLGGSSRRPASSKPLLRRDDRVPGCCEWRASPCRTRPRNR